MGDESAALATFREALAYDFGNPSVKYHLAETLLKVDRVAEAGRHLREALDSSRSFADREKAIALQEKLSTGRAQ